VSGLTVNGQGARRNQHPTSFEQMSLEFVLCSKDVTDQDMQQAIRLAEQSICPVWAMLKNSVEIATSHSIVV
jgi:putative redox protein